MASRGGSSCPRTFGRCELGGKQKHRAQSLIEKGGRRQDRGEKEEAAETARQPTNFGARPVARPGTGGRGTFFPWDSLVMSYVKLQGVLFFGRIGRGYGRARIIRLGNLQEGPSFA